MDLRQLTALEAIAEHGSFSAAARALHTVQSNVSTHIGHLEAELGETLIDRSSGALTEAGEAVLARTRRIQAELAAIQADVASMREDVRGEARLGVIGTTARWLVPPLLMAMRQRHPRVQVVVVDATTTSLVPRLASGQLDLAIINLPIDEPAVATEALFDEDEILVAPRGHALFDAGEVKLSDLSGVPLLLSAPGTAFRNKLAQAARNAGAELVPLAEIDGIRLLASLAFEGYGAAVLPASAAPMQVSGGWTRVRILDAPGREVGLATPRRGLPSAPVRALRSVLDDVVRGDGNSQPGIRPAARLTVPPNSA